MKSILFYFILFFLFFINILSASPKRNTGNDISKAPVDKNEEGKISEEKKYLKSEVSNKENYTVKIPLIYISDFEGRFINVDEKTKGSYYELLGKIKYYQNILPLINNWERPLTLNNGASFWPSISIRFLLNQPKGIDLVYSLLKENGFDIINFGKKDFYTPYSLIKKLSENKKIKSLPFMASNMDCLENAAPICKLINRGKYRIIKINNIKIAIISIISHEVIEKAFYKSIKGINITPEVETANKIAKFLKEKKDVDIIILLAQTEDRETNPRKTLLLSEKLKNIDVVISNSQNVKLISKFSDNSYILGSNPSRYTPNLVLLTLKKGEKSYFIEKIENLNDKYKYKSKVSIVYKKILDKYKKEYLTKYDKPINSMKISEINFKNFYTFILKLMMYHTDSEIAVINEANFNSSLFPIKKLTSDMIEKTIVYNNKLVTFEIKGKLLRKFLKKYKDKLLIEGVTYGIYGKKLKIKINGHFLIDKKPYKVVTTDFLANGGDGFFKDAFYVKDKEYYENIKNVFIDYLKKDKFKTQKSTFNPNKEFSGLYKKFLWELYGNLGIYYIKNDISNLPKYNKSKFDAAPNELLKFDTKINFKGSSKYHIIENNFELHYYQTNENDEFVESDDLISYSLNYKSNYFKAGRPFNFFIPLPFLESKLNTELTKAETENKHYFELFFLSGMSFLSSDKKFEIRMGLQGSKDFRFDEDILLGGIIGYKLTNYKVKKLKIPVKLDSRFNYFIGFNQTNIIDFSATVNIPILGLFYFSTKGEAYGYKEIDKKWSYAYNFFFGVNIIYNDWYR